MILRWVAALTCLLLAAPRALAAEPDIAFDGCVDVDPADFARLLDIELRTLDANLDRLSRLDLACHGEQVEVVASWPDRPITRAELNVSQTERQAVTRLLALRVSELLASASAPAQDAVTVEPTAPAAARATPQTPLAQEPHYSVSLGPTVRNLGSPRTWLIGLSAGATAQPHAHLVFKSDLSLELGEAHASQADVTFRQVSASIAALWNMRMGSIDLGAGPGLRGSYAWLKAHDSVPGKRPQSLGAPWAGPMVTARLALHSKSAWLVALDAEAGWVTLPVQGLIDGKERLLTIDGLWLGAQASVAYGW